MIKPPFKQKTAVDARSLVIGETKSRALVSASAMIGFERGYPLPIGKRSEAGRLKLPT